MKPPPPTIGKRAYSQEDATLKAAHDRAPGNARFDSAEKQSIPHVPLENPHQRLHFLYFTLNTPRVDGTAPSSPPSYAYT